MNAGSHREIAIPAQGLTKFRTALRDEVGPVAAVHALHSAGFVAGEELFEIFTGALGSPVQELPQTELWAAFSRFYAQRGWGTIHQRAAHPGIALLESPDWAEAVPGSEKQPQCALSTGMFSGFLSRLAGHPVAVLEVACRSRGDELCRFAFGSEANVQRLYEHLLEGATVEQALERL